MKHQHTTWGVANGGYKSTRNGFARTVSFSSRDENAGYALPH
ncbi:MAG: hypothetical protein RBR68_12750 [Tenuifilaceae bacterium]|nr:hypothetical protein [Tenuifilaceae bacterium]